DRALRRIPAAHREVPVRYQYKVARENSLVAQLPPGVNRGPEPVVRAELVKGHAHGICLSYGSRKGQYIGIEVVNILAGFEVHDLKAPGRIRVQRLIHDLEYRFRQRFCVVIGIVAASRKKTCK